MNKLMVWFQRRVELADGAVNFCEGQKKLMRLLAIAGSQLRDWLVWGQFLDPNINQDTIGKLSSRAFDWCNKNMVVPV
jgi:hypothetical protein